MTNAEQDHELLHAQGEAHLSTHASASAQILHVQRAALIPRVAIEGATAILGHAVRVNYVEIEREQSLQNVKRELDHVYIKPKHPVLVTQRPE